MRGLRQRRYHRAAACWRTRYGDGSHFSADRILGACLASTVSDLADSAGPLAEPGIGGARPWRCMRSRWSATFACSRFSMGQGVGGDAVAARAGRVGDRVGPEGPLGSGRDRTRSRRIGVRIRLGARSGAPKDLSACIEWRGKAGCGSGRIENPCGGGSSPPWHSHDCVGRPSAPRSRGAGHFAPRRAARETRWRYCPAPETGTSAALGTSVAAGARAYCTTRRAL